MQKSLLYRPTSPRPPPLLSIDVDSSCKRVICGTADSRVLLINANTGRPQRALTAHANVVSAVVFLQGSSNLLSVSWDGSVRKWHLGRTVLEKGVMHLGAACKSVALDKSTGAAAVGSQDGSVTLFSYNSMEPIRTLKAHHRDVSALAFLQNGESLLTASWDGSCRLWDLTNGTLVREIVQCGERVQSIAVSSNQTKVFLGLHSGKIVTTSLDISARSSVAPIHSDAVSVLLCSPLSSHVISGGWDASIRIWSPENTNSIVTQRTLTGITDMALCRKSNSLYVTDFSGTVTLWSLEDGQ